MRDNGSFFFSAKSPGTISFLVLHGNVWGKFLFSEQANKLPRRGRGLACPTYDRAEHYETYVTFAA